ncbi:unnamed protein product [Oppiella nova]|uniref:Uncharacterized protein n=1 Tax=Oppiella nova TaxID=334625 RepID=A0A7R9M1A4_9ACAR|nr:unnamed protein product [Oppiella nova]CAG2168377.1 unnamed protein product [Oppiella nova]
MEAIGSDSSDLRVCDDMSGDNAVTNGSVVLKDSTGSLDMTQRFNTSLVVSQTTPSSKSSLEFSKDSFDRIGDDLCQLLLSYLPFEEHFRRECLSKQFQRCLHISIKVLTITDTLFAKMRAKCGSSETHILTDILKKCPNIQTIDCYHILNYESYMRPVLSAIDESNSWKLSVDVMNAMKFMPRLRRLDLTLRLTPDAEVVTDCRMFDGINACKRLTHLTLNLWRLHNTAFTGIETNHRKLQVLSITTTDEDNNYKKSDFEAFIMRSSHKLSAFTVRQSGRPVIHFNDQQIYELRHN